MLNVIAIDPDGKEYELGSVIFEAEFYTHMPESITISNVKIRDTESHEEIAMYDLSLSQKYFAKGEAFSITFVITAWDKQP